MITKVKHHLEGLLNIVYPQFCAACGNVLYSNENVLCLNCYTELPRTRFHAVPDNDVARIFWGRIPVSNATAFMFFTGNSRYRQVLHELKYHGQQHIGLEMGKVFGLELTGTGFANADVIIPVPLHASKQIKRGYNQSELIAKGISAALNIPLEPGLMRRISATPTQTKKTRYERWENVNRRFAVVHQHLLVNKHVLLVDDVITTGATLESCAMQLLQTEGVSVSIAALACVKLQ